MRSNQTQTLALLSGILPQWDMAYTNDTVMDIQPTDATNPDRAVSDTVALMGTHARKAASSTQVRQALQLAGCIGQGMTEDDVIGKVFRWIKASVTFVEDNDMLAGMFSKVGSKELLVSPPVLLSMEHPRGDCDDFSMLVCSMLMAKGITCDFVTIAANRDNPNEFSHVYALAGTRDGRRIPFDASHGKYAGWEKQDATRKQVWPVFNFTGGNGGLGMTIGTMASRNSLAGILGSLGDDTLYTDAGVDPSYAGTQYSSTVTPDIILPGTYSGGYTPNAPGSGYVAPTQPSIWNSLLPGIFGAAEKVAIQTTQQPGLQTTGPGGTSSSYVLPSGATSLPNLPGMPAIGGSSMLPILLIGGVLLAVFAMNKG